MWINHRAQNIHLIDAPVQWKVTIFSFTLIHRLLHFLPTISHFLFSFHNLEAVKASCEHNTDTITFNADTLKLLANSCLFTHPAVMEQRYRTFGVMCLSTCRTQVHYSRPFFSAL